MPRLQICLLCLLTLASTLGMHSAPQRQKHADSLPFTQALTERPLILIPKEADAPTRTGAQLIARVLQAVNGISVKVLDEASVENALFYVGEVERNKHVFSDYPFKDEQTIAITISPHAIHIAGGSDSATLWACAAFLREHLGVRWFHPGELGECLPLTLPITLACERLRIRPDFLSRRFFGFSAKEQAWLDLQGRFARDEAHHHLYALFTREVFDTHPEWFSEYLGKRRRPSPQHPDPQPNLVQPEAAEYAAAQARAFFETHPKARSFSLAINDSLVFDQSEQTLELISAESFRSKPDYSPLVFTFMNRAARVLERTHPEKKLGALAYFFAENTPPFPIHRQVIPYLTSDRQQWYDPEYKREDIALMERWSQSGAEEVGIYDYYYGCGYLFPRMGLEFIVESLRHAHAVGITGFVAEINPLWGMEGAKPWLVTRLLWDSDQDVDALLEDYYTRYYQEAAAPMRAYWKNWQKLWRKQPGKAAWLKYFRNPAQFELIDETFLADTRASLHKAVALTDNSTVLRRIARVEKAFAVTDAFSHYYRNWKRMMLAEGVTPEMIEQTLQSHQRMLIKLDTLLEAVEPHLRSTYHLGLTHLTGIGDAALRTLGNSNDELDFETRKNTLLQLAGEFDSEPLRLACRIAYPPGQMRIQRNLIRNGSFANPLGTDIPLASLADPAHTFAQSATGWRFQAQQQSGLILEQSNRQGGALRIGHAAHLLISQETTVKPKETYRVRLTLEGNIRPANIILASLHFRNKDGSELEPPRTLLVPVNNYDEPHSFTLLAEAPKAAASATFRLTVKNQQAADAIKLLGVKVTTR